MAGWVYPAGVRFRVLGPVEVHTDDGRVLTLRRRQERCLLAILSLEAGRAVPTDRLCALLWPDGTPQRPLEALRSHVARLRALLGEAGAAEPGVTLASRQRGYLLDVDPDAVDVHRFRRLLDAAARTTDLAERDKLLREALAEWHGPPLDRAATDEVRQRLCADLDELHLRATEESLATGIALGRHRDLLPELARAATAQPVRERFVELHMRALYKVGRTAEALDVYHRARARLADELGIDPGPALDELYRGILRGDRIPVAGTRITPALLPAHLPVFAGRREHLDQLDRLISIGANAVVISGTAGVGKTTLAVHAAHLARDRFPDGQLYANLRGFDPTGTAAEPAEALGRFLDALGVPPADRPASVEGQVDAYRSLLAGKRVLVLLDNARDAAQIRPLLPTTHGCFAIVTSRSQLTGLVAVDGAHPLTLDLPDVDEARQMLAARLGMRRVAAEPDAVDRIIARCARLPLALAIAAARSAVRPALPLDRLAEELRDARSRLDALAADDPYSDIRAVFSWSYRSLSAPAARLLGLLGLHPGPHLSTVAAASLAGIPVTAAHRLLGDLTRANLLTQPVPGQYALHDLLRTYAMELADRDASDADRRDATHRTLDHYLHTAHAATTLLYPSRDSIVVAPPQPGVTPESLADHDAALAWFGTEHPVLVGTIDWAATNGFHVHVWQLAWTMAEFLDRRARWHDRIATLEVALSALERSPDPGNPARLHHLVGRAYIRLARHDDADRHLQKSLALYTKAGDATGQAHAHHGLAWERGERRQLAEALDHAERALHLYRVVSHRTGQADALNTVGWYHAQLGNHERAVACCEQALVLHRNLDHPRGQAATWNSLGYSHHHLGHHEQAIDCYRRAVDLYRRLEDRYEQAASLERLGDVHENTDAPNAAAPHWRQAFDLLAALAHPDAERVRAKLGLPRTHDRAGKAHNPGDVSDAGSRCR